MVRLRCVDSHNIFGTMNGGTVSLTNITESDKKMLMEKHNLQSLEGFEIPKEDKALIFKEHRKAFGAAKGFDWHKMFMMDQTTKDGSYFEITKDFVEANPNGWADIPEDILIITDKVPGVVAGYPVADCPVVIMSDIKQGVTAVAHCSAALIDKKLPMMTADALTQGYGSREEDIVVYVGACAGNKWKYNCWPNFATDKRLWDDCITQDGDDYFIDVRKALTKEFNERGLGNCDTVFNLADTITDARYYSHSAHFQNPEKFGRHFEGALYEGEYECKNKRNIIRK